LGRSTLLGTLGTAAKKRFLSTTLNQMQEINLSDILSLVGSQVIVRIAASKVIGCLVLVDPRTRTVVLLNGRKFRIIHGHSITAIEPDTYGEEVDAQTLSYMNDILASFSTPDEDTLKEQLMAFIRSKGSEPKMQDGKICLMNGFVTVSSPYLPSNVHSNNQQLRNQYHAIVSEFYEQLSLNK
jgi:hypothetical protein